MAAILRSLGVRTGRAQRRATVCPARLRRVLLAGWLAIGALAAAGAAASDPSAAAHAGAANPGRDAGRGAPLDSAMNGGARSVSVAAQAADLRGVLAALAAQAGLALQADPDVTGTVTLEVSGVTLGDALDALLIPAGYAYEVRDGWLYVHGERLLTRMFRIDYMTSVRAGATRLSASSGGAGGGSSSDAAAGADENRGGESSFSVDSEMYSDPWAEIVRGLELIVYGEIVAGGGPPAERLERLVVHPSAGVVLVSATLPTLNRVAAYLESISGAVHRQVVIDVHIIEVALDDGLQLGVDWSRIPGASGDVTSVFGHDDVGVRQRLSPNNGVFQIAGSENNFRGLIDALETQGRIKVVSAPTVVTLNNQKAIVKVAREESFFSQRIDYQVQPDGTSLPVSSVDAERITIGLILDVTPQISAAAGIMMHVHPSLTELVGEDVFPPGATGAQIQANAPVLDIREIDTVVEIGDGNMLVIGGLMKNRSVRNEKRVPLLGSLPLLGYFFRRVDYTEEQVELVVVLKPRVVLGEEADEFAAREMQRLAESRMR